MTHARPTAAGTAAAPTIAALTMAVLCHGLFVLAVTSMATALATGMQLGRGTLSGPLGQIANLALLVQFPVIHSALLTRGGRRWLECLSPVGHGRTLAISTYVALGSLQLLAAFWLWSPSGVVWREPSGISGGVQYAVFAAAWLFLVKALHDAGLAVQSGAAGWLALLRRRPVNYGTMPTAGLFGRCRQPIYFGFAAVLWTGPAWTPDWLLLATFWSTYCFVGPRFKEARWEALFGDRFRAYRSTTPYFLPRIRR